MINISIKAVTLVFAILLIFSYVTNYSIFLLVSLIVAYKLSLVLKK